MHLFHTPWLRSSPTARATHRGGKPLARRIAILLQHELEMRAVRDLPTPVIGKIDGIDTARREAA